MTQQETESVAVVKSSFSNRRFWLLIVVMVAVIAVVGVVLS